jgi:hypothetical protein
MRISHRAFHPRHAALSALAIVKELGSGREAMPLNIIDWHGNIPRPPALFPTVALSRSTAACI